MEDLDQKINIDEIMQEIRNDIIQKGIIDETIDFEDILDTSNQCGRYNELEWEENLRLVNILNSVHLYRDMPKGIKAFIKRVIRKATAFLLVPLTEEQNNYNTSVTRCLNQLDCYIKSNQDLIDIQTRNSKRLYQLEKKIEYLESQIVEEKLNIKQEIDAQSKNEDNWIKLEKKVQELESFSENIRNNNAQISQLELSKEMMNTKLNMLLEEKKKPLFKSYEVNKKTITKDNMYSSIDYFDFENYFRGTREEVKKNQTQYAEFFLQKTNVLDLGCGRGEFLEVLKDRGIDAIGIDIYNVYVEYCKEKGFRAKEADAVEYLRGCNHVGGIFCGQLIEHLDIDKIIELCSLAYEKLQKNCYFVIETPNPMSLAIFTHSFYIDPSHGKPVHPYTMQYFLKKAGFSNIRIIFTESSKLSNNIIHFDIENKEENEKLNTAMSKVWNTLYGSQDYSIIAQK